MLRRNGQRTLEETFMADGYQYINININIVLRIICNCRGYNTILIFLSQGACYNANKIMSSSFKCVYSVWYSDDCKGPWDSYMYMYFDTNQPQQQVLVLIFLVLKRNILLYNPRIFLSGLLLEIRVPLLNDWSVY